MTSQNDSQKAMPSGSVSRSVETEAQSEPSCRAGRMARARAAMQSVLSRFARDGRGTITMIFAICSLVIIGMVALGLDYGRALSAQIKLQQSIDAALLAATADTSDSTRVTTATNYMNAAYYDGNTSLKSATFSYDSATATVTGTAIASMPTAMSGWWRTSLDVKVTSAAQVAKNQVRALDITFCIDATGSMYNTLSAVQSNAISFKNNLDTALTGLGLPSFDQYRVRVVYYRDYVGVGAYVSLYSSWFGWPPEMVISMFGGIGDNPALWSSSFYNLPNDVNAFSNFVTGVSAGGGFDLPESGAECLNESMDSAWTAIGTTLSNGKKVTDVYPVIAIYTDAGAHPPGYSWDSYASTYPSASKMPRDYATFLAKWNNASVIDQTHKMILFYGDPDIQDDFNGIQSAWSTVKTWPGFTVAGSLTSANTSFVSSLAAGIAKMYGSNRLTN